jgi:pyruvate/2-oxoglutarate dehydrogenase complex dihydrolipoamide acyltransferase (E2) component
VLALALLLPALPAAASETLLLLGVLREGQLDTKVTHAVHDRLIRSGETVAAASQLSAAERQCLLPECMESLAGREKAQIVLAARVQQSAGFAYIAASMYDVVHQRPLDVCDKCLPEAVALRVGDLFTRLLRDSRDRLRAEATAPRRPIASAGAPSPSASASPAPAAKAAASPGTLVASKGVTWPTTRATAPTPPEPTLTRPGAAAASATPAEAPEPAATRLTGSTPSVSAPDAAPAPRERASAVALSARPSERPRPLSPRRKLIAGILGGVGIATLITAFALNVTDGRATTMDCDAGAAMTKVCVLDNKVAYTLGYAATSALAVSIGMTLFWPEPKPRSSEVK